MKSFQNFIDEGKKCPDGEYYCNTDKKCKPIPRGYRIGYGGFLRKENDNDDSNKGKNGKNGNGGSNGNGNGGHSNGNSSNGGGNGGGNGGSGGGE